MAILHRTDMNTRVLVIAENHRVYRQDFRQTRITHKYFGSLNALHGTKYTGIYLHGRWWRNPVLQKHGYSYIFSMLSTHLQLQPGQISEESNIHIETSL